MRPFAILVALALAGSAAATTLPASPACGDPQLQALCVRIVIGDIVVLSGQEEELNNGTYAIEGSITVEDGGRVEIILSDVALGSEDEPIHVKAGGTLVISNSTLTAAPGGAPPVIRLDPGAKVEIYESAFTGTELIIASDDVVTHQNTFAQGSPAVRLVDVTGEFRGHNDFRDNAVGVNVTRGSPHLKDLVFDRDAQAIELWSTSADLSLITMRDVLNGVRAVNSQGTYMNMALDDRTLPPDVGFLIVGTSSTTTIRDNEIAQFGIGIRCEDADVILQDNDFAENGQDVVGC